MNKEKTIQQILDLGLKEYKFKTGILQKYDRAWQKKINDDLFVNVHFWEHSKYENGKDSFEIEIYRSSDDGAEKILIYSFSDFSKAYNKALEFIGFLLE